MTPEQLAELWQNELSKDVRYKTWQQFTCEEIDARVRVATTVLEKLAFEKYALLDQGAAESIARLDMQVRRLNSEIFATRITRHSNDGGETKRRQTLLGRIDELSSMAALGPVDQSFFLE
jgi:hypothetical protein